jgi:hypothetical protein
VLDQVADVQGTGGEDRDDERGDRLHRKLELVSSGAVARLGGPKRNDDRDRLLA